MCRVRTRTFGTEDRPSLVGGPSRDARRLPPGLIGSDHPHHVGPDARRGHDAVEGDDLIARDAGAGFGMGEPRRDMDVEQPCRRRRGDRWPPSCTLARRKRHHGDIRLRHLTNATPSPFPSSSFRKRSSVRRRPVEIRASRSTLRVGASSLATRTARWCRPTEVRATPSCACSRRMVASHGSTGSARRNRTGRMPLMSASRSQRRRGVHRRPGCSSICGFAERVRP